MVNFDIEEVDCGESPRPVETSLAQWAMQYRDAGLSVIPVGPDKRPTCPNGNPT